MCSNTEKKKIIYHQSEFGIREIKKHFFVHSTNKILAVCSNREGKQEISQFIHF